MATVKDTIEYNFLANGINKLTADIEKINSTLKQSSKSTAAWTVAFSTLKNAAFKVFSSIKNIAVTTVKTIMKSFSNFEQQSFRIWFVSGTGIDELMKKLKGIDTAIGSMTDVARLTTSILMQGINDVDVAIEYAVNALKLARVGFADVNVVVDALIPIMRNYGDELGNVEGATNALLTASTLAQGGLTDLIDGMMFLTKPASQLNISFNELAGAYATASLAGYGASRGATYLMRAIMQLMKPTDKLKLLLEKMGEASYNDMIKKYGLVKALRKLSEAMKENGITAAEAFTNVRGYFGYVGLQTDNFNKLEEAINKMTTQAKDTNDVFDKWKKTLAGLWVSIKNKLINLMIEIGNKWMPQIKKFGDDLANWIDTNKEKITEAVGEFGKSMLTLVDGLRDALKRYNIDANKILTVLTKIVEKAIKLVDWLYKKTQRFSADAKKVTMDMDFYIIDVTEKTNQELSKMSEFSLNSIKNNLQTIKQVAERHIASLEQSWNPIKNVLIPSYRDTINDIDTQMNRISTIVKQKVVKPVNDGLNEVQEKAKEVNDALLDNIVTIISGSEQTILSFKDTYQRIFNYIQTNALPIRIYGAEKATIKLNKINDKFKELVKESEKLKDEYSDGIIPAEKFIQEYTTVITGISDLTDKAREFRNTLQNAIQLKIDGHQAKAEVDSVKDKVDEVKEKIKKLKLEKMTINTKKAQAELDITLKKLRDPKWGQALTKKLTININKAKANLSYLGTLLKQIPDVIEKLMKLDNMPFNKAVKESLKATLEIPEQILRRLELENDMFLFRIREAKDDKRKGLRSIDKDLYKKLVLDIQQALNKINKFGHNLNNIKDKKVKILLDISKAQANIDIINNELIVLKTKIESDKVLNIKVDDALKSLREVKKLLEKIKAGLHLKMTVHVTTKASPEQDFTKGIAYIKRKLLDLPSEKNFVIKFNKQYKNYDDYGNEILPPTEAELKRGDFTYRPYRYDVGPRQYYELMKKAEDAPLRKPVNLDIAINTKIVDPDLPLAHGGDSGIETLADKIDREIANKIKYKRSEIMRELLYGMGAHR